MKSSLRWLTFNLVGAVGMAVQLSSLALLNRLLNGHYLIATAAALEITLLHNFAWHSRCTWRDRRGTSSRWRQCMRFHLSSGLVSLAGNLGLMRPLVHGAHLPVLAADTIAILCCSAANFWCSHRWAFTASPIPAAPAVEPCGPRATGATPAPFYTEVELSLAESIGFGIWPSPPSRSRPEAPPHPAPRKRIRWRAWCC